MDKVSVKFKINGQEYSLISLHINHEIPAEWKHYVEIKPPFDFDVATRFKGINHAEYPNAACSSFVIDMEKHNLGSTQADFLLSWKRDATFEYKFKEEAVIQNIHIIDLKLFQNGNNLECIMFYELVK